MQTTIFQGVDSENPRGILTVFEINRKFTDADESFLSFMAYILSLKASDPGFEAKLAGYKNEQLLHDLIRGVQVEAKPELFSSMFGTLFANYHLFLIDTKNLSSYTVDNIKYTLLRRCHFSTCLMRGSYLVFIANISPQEQAIVFSAAEDFADKLSLAIGVSEPFSAIYRLKKFYTQAKRAREAGITMKCSHGVFKFEDIKDEILVADLSAMESMELYVNEAFDHLAEHDHENDTEYCKTLREYILCGMDNAKTLQKLNIHRNTLSYRLNRIEEICGKSLNDGRFLVSMYFSGIIRSIPRNGRIVEDE